ncbi:hypothetical protein P692DRAFT_20761227 [Suillus brevipes Sb2]|nr:hypothetical protein P692DRAFT_20761227 [Suillus brevipes Sb2]
MSSYADKCHATTTTMSHSESEAIMTRMTRRAAAAVAMKEEQNLKESETGTTFETTEAIVLLRAQASESRTPTVTVWRPGQSLKRKSDHIDSDDNSNKENLPTTRPAVAVKRIRREKTGTEWQTVLDVVKFGEEDWQRRQKEIKGTAAVFEKRS